MYDLARGESQEVELDRSKVLARLVFAAYASKNPHLKELSLWRNAGVAEHANPNYTPIGRPMVDGRRVVESFRIHGRQEFHWLN